MTSSATTQDDLPTSSITILSNAPTRARRIEDLIRQVPAFGRHTVFIVPVKKHFESKGECTSLLILDDENGFMDPLQWVKLAHTSCPDANVVLIGPRKDPQVASRALRAGASAFIAGDEYEELLPDALTHIAEGERFVSEDVMQGILHGMVQTGEDGESLPIETLSDREMTVFQLLGEGRTLQKIADELGVNIKTVATHCNNIRRKLRTRDNEELYRVSRSWALERSPVKH